MTFLHSGDRFYLKRYASLFDVGVYGIAYRFGTLAGYIQPIFETYWNVQVFNVVKSESGERHYTRTLTYFALVSATSAVVVSLFSQPIVRLATPKPYHQAMAISPLIACCYAWRGVGDYFRNAFAVNAQTKKNVIVTLSGVLLAFITYSTLIPRYKIWGAAIATAITFLGMSFVIYREAQKVHRYQFEWRRLALIMVCSLAVILPYPLLAGLHIYLQFPAAALLTLAFPVLLWIVRFFEPSELAAGRKLLEQGLGLLSRRFSRQDGVSAAQ
jgi:O-antigen/teichoic acid export membrane protein